MSRNLSALIGILSEPPDLAPIADPGSWALLKETASREGLAPMVAYIARAHVRPSERQWCDQVLTRSWTRYHSAMRQLEQVAVCLQGADVRAVALKGPLLAARCYQPPFLRKPSGDIDLAVRTSDVQSAWAALAAIGYKSLGPLDEALARSHHVTLTHPQERRIELHVRLSHGPCGLAVDSFMGRSVVAKLPNGAAIATLSPADELLHLMLHRSSGLATLFHLYELRRLWKSSDALIQREALQRAARLRLIGIVRLTDLAFRAHWGEPFVPAGVEIGKTWLSGRIDESLYREFEMQSSTLTTVTFATRLRRRWLDLQLTDRPTDALRWVLILGRASVLVAWLRFRGVVC